MLVDQRHPSLFDHPLDHIPGAVLFESIRQAGILAAHEIHGLSARRIVLESLRAEFTRFGELDLHTAIKVHPIDDPASGYSFDVEITQEDETITSGQIRFTKHVNVEVGSTTAAGGTR